MSLTAGFLVRQTIIPSGSYKQTVRLAELQTSLYHLKVTSSEVIGRVHLNQACSSNGRKRFIVVQTSSGE